MAPILMHAVIGERVYPQIAPLARTRALGSFLLGCMLVDVNGFSDLDRRETHFVGRPNEDGEQAFSEGSATFLRELDTLLQRPWDNLSPGEQAFVAGYLCHLAADEAWKEVSWRALWAMGIKSVDQFPIPAGVLLTAYSILSAEHYVDAAAVADALRQVEVPDVLARVPHEALVEMWRIIKPGILQKPTLASHLSMLERKGLTAAEIEARRQLHEEHMDGAVALINEWFDVATMIEATADRSLEIVPRLWDGPLRRAECHSAPRDVERGSPRTVR
jgi:hypothetical protein